MFPLFRVAMCLAVSLLCASPAVVQAFEFVPPDASGGTPSVIHGIEVTSPSTWPATFIFKSGVGSCTSTAVGQRVVLTAAHCVKHEEAGVVRTASGPVAMQCFHHPDYDNGNVTTDFALCLTASELEGIPFEAVSSAIAFPRVNQPVVLLGFGCIEAGGIDHTFGRLFMGVATVIRTPKGADIDIQTKGPSALCFGDSGGAAYVALTDNLARRMLVAVNSRGDISQFSFLSSTATSQFVDWAIGWSADRGVTICGLDVHAKGCR